MIARDIRQLRDMTGETQKEFAERFHIPLSTLKKWEQGSASPAPYVLSLIRDAMPAYKASYQELARDGVEVYYYDPVRHMVSDRFGNEIRIDSDPEQVNGHNLFLYLHDLYAEYYQMVERFNRDCRLDREEGIVWT